MLAATKVSWDGLVLAVQPRIGLLRSFDQRSHVYAGYTLRVRGRLGSDEREFLVGLGPAAHERHQLRAGDRLSGEGMRPAAQTVGVVDIHRVSKLRVLERGPESSAPAPPWLGVPPPLPTYRQRGHRRLDRRTYDARCTTCIWGCLMPVEMIIDHWNPSRRRYREETFCYGPLSCSLYRAGPTRKVPGRRGMTWVEEDWVDDEAVGHREPDA